MTSLDFALFPRDLTGHSGRGRARSNAGNLLDVAEVMGSLSSLYQRQPICIGISVFLLIVVYLG